MTHATMSRRKALAAVAVAPAALAALPTLGLCNDVEDPALAAIAAHKAAYEKADRLYQKLDEAEDLAEKVYGRRQYELITWRNYHIGDWEIDERYRWFQAGRLREGEDPKQIEREYHDAKRRYRETIRAGKDWDKRTGIAPLRRKYEQAQLAVRKAASQLAKTKPITAAGAGALIAYINHDIGDDHCSHWHGNALKTVAAALSRI